MKKIILALALVSTSAIASGFLQRCEVAGVTRYCFYSDGGVIMVQSFAVCPMSN